MKSVVVEAFEIAEAVEKGAKQLNASVDDVEFEIISASKSTWFGLKRVPARVRVTLNVTPQVEVQRPVVKSPYTGKEVPRGKARKPEVERRRVPRDTEENIQFGVVKSADKDVAKPEKSTLDTATEDTVDCMANVEIATDTQQEQFTADVLERANATIEYLSNIVKLMKVEDVALEVESIKGKKVSLSFSGKNANQIIGHRGETLDALQLIASVCINNNPGEFIKLDINSDNYRQQRERSLKSLATRLSKQAIRTGRVIKLEPMNSYERRIIHSVVSEIGGVNSVSEGESWTRHIVIVPDKKSVPDSGKRSRSERGKSTPGYVGSDGIDAVATRIDDSEFFDGAELGVPLVSGDSKGLKGQSVSKVEKQISGSSGLYTKISLGELGAE